MRVVTLPQWAALISVVVATAVMIPWWESSRWNLGLETRPLIATRELILGAAFAIALIGTCDLLIVLTTDVRHAAGTGFPWRELVLVFIPAAVHEELLFRGYPFQKLYRWKPAFAIVFVAFVFSAFHIRNKGIDALPLLNIFLGGILLGLAYARFERLWFPIGLHLAWNLMSGPILGHEVSGYVQAESVAITIERGPEWLTGAEFGIEGSAWMTAVEIAAIVVLASNIIARRRVSSAQHRNREST
ncbi:MAG TPA: CPBP family intramembrane glutamic endopeptidase [Thermoanaerobaculia bacterium]|nr:CPBP family intramembrane glutamic endopeptidase [Thermoanaerobaculia bacterium]